jgi:hydroxymethylpyrimidine/phosphomethylpyrimidine kinase
MVAESGARLLEADAQRALVEEILPLASVATPNVPEARVLAGWGQAGERAAGEGAVDEGAVGDRALSESAAGERAVGEGQAEERGALADADTRRLARAVLALGPRAVVLTGGHRGGGDADSAALTVDLFVGAADGQRGEVIAIPGERHPGGAAHGSGCTHSSVLAAQLALGLAPLAAARVARRLAGEAVAHGLRDIGAGAGPVDVLGLERLRGGIIDQR